jgi:hypothetical protein
MVVQISPVGFPGLTCWRRLKKQGMDGLAPVGSASASLSRNSQPFDETEALAWLRSQPDGRVTVSAAELARRLASMKDVEKQGGVAPPCLILRIQILT